MRTIPIEDQNFPSDPLGDLKYLIDSPSGLFSGDDVLRAIEYVAGRSMPTLIRDLVKKAKFKGLRRRGHPIVFSAAQDFAFLEFDARYRALLRKYRREAAQQRELSRSKHEKRPKAEASPSERAYLKLMPRYKKELGTKDWKSLRNMHTKWKQGHFHKQDDNPEPFEFDEMVEKYFPAPNSSS